MDRNTVTGLILIFFITLAWAWYTMPSQEQLEQQRLERAMQDSIAAAQTLEDREPAEETRVLPGRDEVDTIRPDEAPTAGLFGLQTVTDTVSTVVRTPLYEIELTNLGAGPARYTLLAHNTWEKVPVQMIHDTTRSAYSLGFLSAQNYNIETNQLLFEPINYTPAAELTMDESRQLSYRLRAGNDAELIFTYTFYADRYQFDLDIEFINMESQISDFNVDFGWLSALTYTERDVVQDAQNSGAYIFAGEVLEKFQQTEPGRGEQVINGRIDWVSSRTRFFGQYIKPVTETNAAIVRMDLDGPLDNPDTIQRYETMVTSNIASQKELSFQLYAGPLRYYDLREFDDNAYDVVEIGYALIRWFADPLVRWVIIPFFVLGSTVISNYGVLIILFGVLVKLVLYPLTQKSFKSMAAMKELQPQMQEIRDKYKDDPQKQQKETIALYRKAKVNPVGGCLPMLLQFPILITLFFFFQNSMIIRQQSFLWADDLSAPDYILSLPFSIPLLGDQLAGFVILMAGAMFIQTKITGSMSGMGAPSAPGTPNMKVFTYIIPFILLFVFNNFASGLSLYYLVYNVLSGAQQLIINKTMKKPEIDTTTTSGTKGKKKGKKKKKK
ncbi:MAG: membrane protein insertase YidC [Balneolaceae bacterium]